MSTRNASLGLVALLVVLAILFWRDSAPEDTDAGKNDEAEVAAGAADRADDVQKREPDTEAGAVRAVSGEAKTETKVPGRLLVRVVWHDGEPAPDVGVRCSASYPQVLAGGKRFAVSNDEGIAVFDGLGACKVSLQANRGGRVKAEVFADRESEVTLKVDRGVDVEGVVVDSQGASIAGAAIWLTTRYYRNWLGGRVVTHSDESGEFRVRSADKGQSLGAIAPGHERSKLTDLDTVDVSKSPVRIRLELVRGGGTVSVRVVDSKQRPVVGALVAVGVMPKRFKQRSGMAYVETWTPRVLECDNDGRAVAHGLPSGEHPLAARHTGSAVWTGTIRVEAGRTTEKIVTLGPPVVVHGTATDAAGRPVARAVVRAVPGEFNEVFLQSGQFDFKAVFDYPMTTTGDDGRYRLDTVAPGQVHLHAQMPRTGKTRETLFRTKKPLQAAAGSTIEWNPVLAPGHTIKGLVTYRCSTPMPNVFITALEQESGKRNVIVADPKGRFRFVNLNACAYSVRVQLRSPPQGSPPLVKNDVWPDQVELRIAASYDAPLKLPHGSVRGRVIDVGKRIKNQSALLVMLVSDKKFWNTKRDLKDGKFHFERVKPGRYKIAVKCREDIVYDGDWFEVKPRVEEDVGVLRTAVAGSILLRLKRGRGTEDVQPSVYLTPPDSIHSTKLEPGTAQTFRNDNVSAGSYKVRMHGAGIVSRSTKVTVVAGSVVTLDLELEAAILTRLRIVLPPDTGDGQLRVYITDSKGKQLWERTFKNLETLVRPFDTRRSLPLGRLTLHAETTTGLRGSTSFEVEKATGDPPLVSVELR